MGFNKFLKRRNADATKLGIDDYQWKRCGFHIEAGRDWATGKNSAPLEQKRLFHLAVFKNRADIFDLAKKVF